MFYILNKRKQIVAADNKLLALCGVSHIDELSVQIALGNTIFTPLSEKSMHLVSNDTDEILTMSETPLSSMIGHLTLVKIKVDKKKEEKKHAPLIIDNDEEMIADEALDLLSDTANDTIDENESLSLEDEPISVESKTEDEPSTDEITLADHLSVKYNDELLDEKEISEENIDISDTLEEDIKEDTSESEEIDLFGETETVETDKEEDTSESEEIDLFGETENENVEIDKEEDTSNSEEIDLFGETENENVETDKKEDTSESEEIDLFGENDMNSAALVEEEITLDAEKISRNIGISVSDYNNFLNEYIDTALNFEKDLQSENIEKRDNAIKTLSNLSDVLHLPVLGEILDNVENASSETQRPMIESFYSALSRMTTSSNPKTDLDTTVTEAKDDEPQIQEAIIPDKQENPNGFGTIDLSDVKPIHFDFLLDEAANDLSLPVELIEEFVHDFIEQAHVETKKMLEAYEEGNLDTIQKIGHLLKGASSNLRINTLSDTLYRIQFCEDTSQLEALIKDYWGHFLSFETKINAISK